MRASNVEPRRVPKISEISTYRNESWVGRGRATQENPADNDLVPVVRSNMKISKTLRDAVQMQVEH